MTIVSEVSTKKLPSRVNHSVCAPTTGSRSKDRARHMESCFFSSDSLCGHWNMLNAGGSYP